MPSLYAKNEGIRRLWRTPGFKDKKERILNAAQHSRPNKSEILLVNLANIACPNEYQYTGDGTIIVDGLSPDLSNIDGQKKVILMHGDYWHEGENTQFIIDRYAKFGYDCLIIWEHELENRDEVIEKIRKYKIKTYMDSMEIKTMPNINQQLSMPV